MGRRDTGNGIIMATSFSSCSAVIILGRGTTTKYTTSTTPPSFHLLSNGVSKKNMEQWLGGMAELVGQEGGRWA